MTKGQAAAYCNMSVSRFRDWDDDGKIKSIPSSPASNRREYLKEHLDEFQTWLAQQAEASAEP
ncbi:MAG: hypothetical protein AAGJ40_02765 [Planctomycetota bacterium]